MKEKEDKLKLNKPLSKSSNRFPVVGIGASAGGLDAFKKLIKSIPEDSGMAYVLVQHLDPKHDSLLPELLQKVTKLPVMEISDDIRVKADHIYIIPSNKMLVANDGVLELSPRPEKSRNERNLPIDLFFTSLAEVHQSHAIGVVLSGTASDGTLGLKAIKEHGGITFAQDEASAAYEGMPHSAVLAGVVDFILPPGEIPNKLKEILGKVILNDDELQNISLPEEETIKQIFTLLRIRKGTDFTYYKQTTIRRRILRRMAINKKEDYSGYLNYLRNSKQEQDFLYQDLLIPVTSFFRDTKVFDNLCNTVFPAIIRDKTGSESVRIWIAGCSTGEEVYSIAVCFKELLDEQFPVNSHLRVQIFATDISEPAISKARAGIYSKNCVKGLSEKQLRDFFTKLNGDYHANKVIRDMCVFAVHNFLKDPPFSKIDFVSCRNVLIYMEPYLQKRALTTFHYALNNRAVLLLGKSETTGSVPDLFAALDKTNKLFTRNDTPGSFVHTVIQRSEEKTPGLNAKVKRENSRNDFQKTADDIILNSYTPAGVVIDDAMNIVHFRGSTGNYLDPSPGKASLNLLKMAKEGLAFELRNILHKAKKENETVVKDNIPVKVNGSLQNITIEAIPLPNMTEPHYLILFRETFSPAKGKLAVVSSKVAAIRKNDEKDLRIKQLELELAQVRDDMRSITEDQETVNEELQSSNEELLSSSEEMQSLNEEMETSKEELQSTNEELTVVNQEMIGLNEQVTAARDYAEAIVATVHEPLLVLTKSLRIKSANDAFYKTFQVNVRETEGCLIYELGNRQWNIAALKDMLEHILPHKTKLQNFEVIHSFPHIGERIMRLNAREMMRGNEDEKLILLAIEDITESILAEKKIAESEAFNRTVLENSPDCVILLDREGKLNYMNTNGQRIMEIDDFNLLKTKNWWEMWGDASQPIIKKAVTNASNGEKTQSQAFNPTAKGTPKWWDIIVSPMERIGGFEKLPQIIAILRDITEQKQRQLKEKELLSRFQHLVMQAPVAIMILKGRNYEVELANDFYLSIVEKGKELIGHPFFESLPNLKGQGIKELFDNVMETGSPFYGSEMEFHILRSNKREQCFFNFVYQPILEQDNTVTGIIVVVSEITGQVVARKKMEAQALMVQDLLLTA
ncbi:MAG: chemotaxis protein CheB, partial [Bacteroidota bacterium]